MQRISSPQPWAFPLSQPISEGCHARIDQGVVVTYPFQVSLSPGPVRLLPLSQTPTAGIFFMMTDSLGLTLLAEGAFSANRGVDIVFVHGLQGYSCWEHQPTKASSNQDGDQAESWLRDWLPKDLPSTRVLTYRYDKSSFRDEGGLADIADRLIDELVKAKVCFENIHLHLLLLVPAWGLANMHT